MNIVKTIKIAPGHYVAAISGGVDSMALLDMLHDFPKVTVTVAHFDHGIRQESRIDRRLVEKAARNYKMPFVYNEGNLGIGASEDTARKARYEFLRQIQKDTNADGIITAHHMDDVLETAAHNLLRGTGRKGMSSLKSVDGIIRPLIHLPKQHLIDYATANHLKWNEDSTNEDLRFRRNNIRHRILPRIREFAPEKFEELKRITRRQAELNEAIDKRLHTILHVQPSTKTLRRYDVAMLPHAVARELVGEWLRVNGKREFSKKHLEKATTALKTARPDTTLVLDKNFSITFGKKHAKLVTLTTEKKE
jgi:tRNA(Ile)-lysidine synthase